MGFFGYFLAKIVRFHNVAKVYITFPFWLEEIAADIETALNKDDSDECPIIVHGINLCEIAEQIQWAIGDPLSELSKADTESVIEKIEPDENKRRKSKRQLRIAICDYIKKNCDCASFKGF